MISSATQACCQWIQKDEPASVSGMTAILKRPKCAKLLPTLAIERRT